MTAMRTFIQAVAIAVSLAPAIAMADTPKKADAAKKDAAKCGSGTVFASSELEITYQIRESADNAADDMLEFRYTNLTASRRVIQFDVTGRLANGKLIKQSMGTGGLNAGRSVEFAANGVRMPAADAYPLTFSLQNVKSCPLGSKGPAGSYESPCASVRPQGSSSAVLNSCRTQQAVVRCACEPSCTAYGDNQARFASVAVCIEVCNDYNSTENNRGVLDEFFEEHHVCRR